MSEIIEAKRYNHIKPQNHARNLLQSLVFLFDFDSRREKLIF
jgi:hypothetical protein